MSRHYTRRERSRRKFKAGDVVRIVSRSSWLAGFWRIEGRCWECAEWRLVRNERTFADQAATSTKRLRLTSRSTS